MDIMKASGLVMIVVAALAGCNREPAPPPSSRALEETAAKDEETTPTTTGGSGKREKEVSLYRRGPGDITGARTSIADIIDQCKHRRWPTKRWSSDVRFRAKRGI